MSSTKKKKLRTAADVISRLTWTAEHSNVHLGYDDRIHGPLEKALEGFQPVSHGGDLPEHRIWYIRSNDQILWDKLGRVDRLFGSGEGQHAPVSPLTHQHISEARANMARREEEKAIRRAEREKQRARKARQRARRAAVISGLQEEWNKSGGCPERFRFQEIPSYGYKVANQWETIGDTADIDSKANGSRVSVVTWNVLFDVFQTEDSTERWRTIIDEIRSCKADIICMQEVTPTFLHILAFDPQIQSEFILSASPEDLKTISPHGNLTMWRRDLGHCRSFQCIDGGRSRAIVSKFAAGLVVANVHLPSNKGEESRAIARKRELAEILGQVQRLAHQVDSPRVLVVGDFNQRESDLISSDSLVDTWEMLFPDDPGYTFDPESNWRAAECREQTNTRHLGALRLDRIYTNGLQPLRCERIGLGCPSDHFGIAAEFEQSDNPRFSLPRKNLWSRHAVVSPDYLLGIVLEPSPGLDFTNQTSSLPIPHITLLHGFVEVHSTLDLALQAIKNTFHHGPPFSLSFDETSLDIFEHANSATLVARPKSCSWLHNLYAALRRTFPQCSQQEANYGHWSPHLSVGSFGSSSAAREFATGRVDLSGGVTAKVGGLTIFKRSAADGKLYALTSIPFAPLFQPMKSIVNDFGAGLHDAFSSQATTIVSELKRAFVEIAGNAFVDIVAYGSHALETSMAGISDVDAIIRMSVTDRSYAYKLRNNLFAELGVWIRKRYSTAKVTSREATAADGNRIGLLTVKLFGNAPAFDLQLCLMDGDGVPYDAESRLATSGLEDTLRIREEVPKSLWPEFVKALRFIKLWAHRRQVYGTGYLGGGGWVVWMLHVVNQAQRINLSASQLVAAFFESARPWEHSISIDLGGDSFEHHYDSPLVVLAHSSKTNFGKTATRSTYAALNEEIFRATQLLKASYGLEALLEAADTSGYSSRIEIIVQLSTVSNKSAVKASATSALLGLLVDLERVIGDASLIRPYLSPVRQDRGLVWRIALKNFEFDWERWCRQAERTLRESLPENGRVEVRHCQV